MPPDQPAAGREKVVAIDPVVQLLNEEEPAGITLILEQRTAILKILREVDDRNVRAIREILHSIPGEQKIGDE